MTEEFDWICEECDKKIEPTEGYITLKDGKRTCITCGVHLTHKDDKVENAEVEVSEEEVETAE